MPRRDLLCECGCTICLDHGCPQCIRKATAEDGRCDYCRPGCRGDHFYTTEQVEAFERDRLAAESKWQPTYGRMSTSITPPMQPIPSTWGTAANRAEFKLDGSGRVSFDDGVTWQTWTTS